MTTEPETPATTDKVESPVIDPALKEIYQKKYDEYLKICQKLGDAGLLFHIRRLVHGRKIHESVFSSQQDFIDNFEEGEKFDKFIREKRKKISKDCTVELKTEKNMIQVWIQNECNSVIVDYFESKARYWLKYGKNGFEQEAADIVSSSDSRIKVKFRPTIEDIIIFHQTEGKVLS